MGEARYGFDAMGVGKGFDAADSWNVALLFLIYAVLSVGIEHGAERVVLVTHEGAKNISLLNAILAFPQWSCA